MVEARVVVELKAVTALAEVHRRQVRRSSSSRNLPVGLLVNFNVATLMKGGVRRVVNPKFADQVGEIVDERCE